ncbi:MAG: GTPase RsgA [Gammaproteobacteria bacterium]|nr:GTPase RsgA [Gammaproteobacteria bacterium]
MEEKYDTPTRDIRKRNILAQARCIKDGFSQLPEHVTERDVLVIGLSGAGKSTLINYLLGTPLIKWTTKIRNELSKDPRAGYMGRRLGNLYPSTQDENRSDIPKIGSIGSTTKYITAYKAGDTLFIDTPGFKDTDNNSQLANALMLEEMLKRSNKNKLLIVIDFNILIAGQGNLFGDFTELLSQLFFLEQLNNCLSSENILFVFMDKRGEKLDHERIRDEIGCFILLLEEQMGSAASPQAFTALKRQREVCSIIQNTVDDRLLFIDPLDKGEGREKIFLTVREMGPIDPRMLDFNTSEIIKFRSELREDFILPYLDLMRHERITFEQQYLSESYRSQLRDYKKLPPIKQRDKISQDLENEKKTLIQYRNQLSELQGKKIVAEQQLRDLSAEEEVEYVTMTGDNRSYTFIEGSSLTGLVTSAGYAGYSAYLASYYAASYAAASSLTGSVWLSTFGVAFGYTILPAAVIFTGAALVKKLTTRFVESTFDLEVTYTGACLTRTEIRYQEITAPDANTVVEYYEIDPNQITISEDGHNCIAKFRKKRAPGTQKSQALCLFGKNENHPVIGHFITGLRNEIAGLEADIIGCESRVEMSEKIVSILEILKQSTEESKLDDLLTTLDTGKQDEHSQYLYKILKILPNIEAVNTILKYISTMNISHDFLNEYRALLERHPRVTTIEAFRTPVKNNNRKNNNEGMLTPVKDKVHASLKLEDTSTETMTSAEKESAFINDIKQKIQCHFNNYMESKESSFVNSTPLRLLKRASVKDKNVSYTTNFTSSLDLLFNYAEFQEIVLHYYRSIPDDRIPKLRGKEEYLLNMILYDKDFIQKAYQPLKKMPIETPESEFSQAIAQYICDSWSDLIPQKNQSNETVEEQRMLEGLHERMQGFFQAEYKKSKSLITVLASLKCAVFEDPGRRQEILGLYKNGQNTELKELHYLDAIRLDKEKIAVLYNLAMNTQQGRSSVFATDVVQYIKDGWQPLFSNKTDSAEANTTLILHHSTMFATRQDERHTNQDVRHQARLEELDRKMTLFKDMFINCIEKTYRLFAVLVKEEAQSTKEDTMEKVSAAIKSTEITTGVSVPFVGGVSVNLSSVVAGILDLCIMVNACLDKRRMERWYDALPEDETQRFSVVTDAALKLAVELSLELNSMPDMSVTILAEIVVQRIISYATLNNYNIYSTYPNPLERLRSSIPYADKATTPMQKKTVLELCQTGMRTSMGDKERSKLSQTVEAGVIDSPTYQAILDHTGWVIVPEKESEPITFVPPKYVHGRAFCVKQGPIDKSEQSTEETIIPARLASNLDLCVEVFRHEMANSTSIVPKNLFLHRRTALMAEGDKYSVAPMPGKTV